MSWPKRLSLQTTFPVLFVLQLLLQTQVVFSKVIQEESGDGKFNACIELIYHHPITLIHYPNFHMRKELKHEVNDYCHCQFIQEKKIRLGEKLQSSLDWAFRDPTDQLGSKDKCSLKTLELFSNETLYAIFYASQIAPFIEDRLKERYEPIARKVASEQSIENRLNCFSKNLFQRCGKIKSLQVTYQCVNDNLKDLEFLSKIEKSCPDFSPDEVISEVTPEDDYL